jgi:lipoprotein-anchoring transpeptidase ErfK/SrfK
MFMYRECVAVRRQGLNRLSPLWASALAVVLAACTTSASAETRNAQGRQSKIVKVDNGPQSRGERVQTGFQFPVGALVIVNNERRLYYITGKGEAVRYRVAVGKNEELWMGRTFVAAKVLEPKWIPVNGDDPVEGGDPANPLGKRALYLDWSLLRIHGTPARGSIGSAVSNGCIRMLNEDVIDVFDRVHFGAPVYAIRSWKDASLFSDIKVTEKLYQDPQAHELAKEELEDKLRERAAEMRDKDASLRRERSKNKAADVGSARNKAQVKIAASRGARTTY